MIVEVPLQLWALPAKPNVFDLYKRDSGTHIAAKS